jgi:hypothetical protein
MSIKLHRTHKRCSRCGRAKRIEEFHRSASCMDGHVGQCKVCANALTATKRRGAREKRQEGEEAQHRESIA